MSDEEKGACLNKQAFNSFADAEVVAKRFKNKNHQRIYKCAFCGKYHLTTEKPKRKFNDDYLSKRDRRFGKRSWSEDHDSGS